MIKVKSKKCEGEENGPIKVLQISYGSPVLGSVADLLFKIYKNTDHSKVQFDFLSTKKTTYALHKDEIEQMGGKVFEIGIKGNIITRKIRLISALSRFLKENNYQIVHIHSGGFLLLLAIAFVAKYKGVKTRIVHSHSSLGDKFTFEKLFICLLKPLLQIFATDYLTCSNKAAESMFPQRIIKQRKFGIIKNGIEAEKFIFNENVRTKKREEFQIKNKFVVGHVGRFCYQKNHDFLINVFKKVHDKYQNSILLLVGGGKLEEAIKAKVKKLGLENSVVFLGMRTDVNQLMQAMDVFVLPSYYEGLGIVGIEAQAAGLQTIASSGITSEMKITELTTFLSLSQSVTEWREKILQYKDGYNRMDMSQEIINAGFHISNTAAELEIMYLDKRL